MTNELRPFDPASARAIEASAKAVGKVTDALTGVGGYVACVFGTLPHNIVGLADDYVGHRRRVRAFELNEEYRKLLSNRGVKEPIEPSLSLSVPLVEAAVDETREVLKDMWARLLANACDPSRSDRVRLSLVDTLKRLDPLDALILQTFGEQTGTMSPNARDFMTARLKIGQGEVLVSFENLADARCIGIVSEKWNPHLTDRGRLLLAAVAP